MAQTSVKKSNTLAHAMFKNRVAYAYIAHFFILFAVFSLFPILAGFGLSFYRWDGMSKMHFIGIENYINLFKDFNRHGTNEMRKPLTCDGLHLTPIGYKVWTFRLNRYL